ncbi:MAG: hypothetical protein DRJ03_27130 [Chloroflexi bacterium]|nr:MAG: hypothetical protein DRJ03_27130 [Chloroflexota bacterium]
MEFEKLSEQQQEVAKALGYCGLFASFEDVQKALAYANDIIKSLDPKDQLAATTMAQCLVNTYATEIASGKIEALIDGFEVAKFEKGCDMDVLNLKDGSVVCINEESIAVYESEKDLYNGECPSEVIRREDV